jgi:uncharacterized protein (TIGR00255 family)
MALSSMTGFGRAVARDGAEELTVEVRSVNGKFCEVKARLPRELASLEADVVRLVKERIARGNVDVSVRRTSPGAAAAPRVDAQALLALTQSLAAAAREAGLPEEIRLADLLAVPGVVAVEERPPDLASAQRALSNALSAALAQQLEVRAREGAALERDLSQRLAAMRLQAAEIARLVPISVAGYRERLTARLRELAGDVEVDPARLAQEVVLFADRCDVAEEQVRLAAHFEEFERLLTRSGPVGRQLEFLLQEMNREVNTTGSKSASAEIARCIVELKTELERLREQVQNVE